MIGIISDTHDNMLAIEQAVILFNERHVDHVIHAGDWISPFTAKIFKKLECPLTGVFGNNDGDKIALTSAYKGIADISDNWRELNINNKKIILSHVPFPVYPDTCDIYVFGHTHEPFIKKEDILVVNPGECGRWLSGKSTVMILHENDMRVEEIEL